LCEIDVYDLSKVAKLNTAQGIDASAGSHGDAALRLKIFSRRKWARWLTNLGIAFVFAVFLLLYLDDYGTGYHETIHGIGLRPLLLVIVFGVAVRVAFWHCAKNPEVLPTMAAPYGVAPPQPMAMYAASASTAPPQGTTVVPMYAAPQAQGGLQQGRLDP
jgi:hypothetical protein